MSIAVVIPCFNYGRFLAQAIESVLGQTLPADEIVVVDDGSTDNTAEVAGRYPQVRYLRKENAGLSVARNFGISHSRSENVLFLDADDILRPDALETLSAGFRKAGVPVGAVIATSGVFDDEQGRRESPTAIMPEPEDILPYVERKVSPELWLLSRRVIRRFVRSNVAPACSSLVARSTYEACGHFDESLRSLEDEDMWIRIANGCALAYIPRTVADIRRHGENITNNKNRFLNALIHLRILDKVERAPWAGPELRQLATRQYGRSAYIIAQHLADDGQFQLAAATMKASLGRVWWQPKAWVWVPTYWWRGRRQRGKPNA